MEKGRKDVFSEVGVQQAGVWTRGEKGREREKGRLCPLVRANGLRVSANVWREETEGERNN